MSLKDKVRLFFKSIIQFLFGLYFISVLNANQDFYVSFENASKYFNLLPDVVNLDLKTPSSPLIISDNKSWDIVYFDPHSKLKSLKNS